MKLLYGPVVLTGFFLLLHLLSNPSLLFFHHTPPTPPSFRFISTSSRLWRRHVASGRGEGWIFSLELEPPPGEVGVRREASRAVDLLSP